MILEDLQQELDELENDLERLMNDFLDEADGLDDEEKDNLWHADYAASADFLELEMEDLKKDIKKLINDDDNDDNKEEV